jgi:hypothetical protein
MFDGEVSSAKVDLIVLAGDLFAGWMLTKGLREDLVMSGVYEVSGQLLQKIEGKLKQLHGKTIAELNQNLDKETYAILFRERLTGLHLCLQELAPLILTLTQNVNLADESSIAKKVRGINIVTKSISGRFSYFIT